jgi:glycosyltransferase involved in cell wall biosynthesis
MRKLVIFVPSIEDGGVEKNLFLITNFFAKKDINVNIITANRDKKKFFDKKVNFISPNSNNLNKKNRFYKTLYSFYLLFKFYLRNKNFMILSFQANIYAIFFSFFFRIDIITRSNTAPYGWSSSYIKRYIFKLFFKYPKKIIVNSYDFKKQLDKEFKVSSICIYNPFDNQIVEKKIKEKINDNFFKKGFFNFINIGRMTDQKDQMLLLKAFNNIKNKLKFRLIIIGKGKNKILLKKYIHENNLNNNIKIVNYKKNPYPYLNKSDFFILSSKYEGLPNVLLEAQFLKKTIISTNCPTGPREILMNGKAGFLFEVGNVSQLEKKIIFVSQKKNLKLLKLKSNLGFKSMDRFDYKVNMNKYLKLVNRFLKFKN